MRDFFVGGYYLYGCWKLSGNFIASCGKTRGELCMVGNQKGDWMEQNVLQ